MIAPAGCGWTPLWNDNTAWSGIARKPRRGEAQGSAEQDHSLSYGLSEEQVQVCLDKRGPG